MTQIILKGRVGGFGCWIFFVIHLGFVIRISIAQILWVLNESVFFYFLSVTVDTDWINWKALKAFQSPCFGAAFPVESLLNPTCS